MLKPCTDTKLTRFIKILARYKKILVEVLVASILLSLLGIATAFYFRFLIDEVLYTGVKITLTLFSVGYALVIVFQALLIFCRNQLMLYMGNKIDAALMFEYFRHILRLPMDFFTSRKTGEILSRINDTATIRYAISSTSLSVVLDSLMLLIGGGFFFFPDPLSAAPPCVEKPQLGNIFILVTFLCGRHAWEKIFSAAFRRSPPISH